MPSPIKSQRDIGTRQKHAKQSSGFSRLQARNENEGSSHESVPWERERLDFYPPQNQTTRTSPLHKTRETKFSPLSSSFTSSSRGGRSKRYSSVSEKEHEAAKRAVWEVTSKTGRHAEPARRRRKMVRERPP